MYDDTVLDGLDIDSINALFYRGTLRIYRLLACLLLLLSQCVPRTLTGRFSLERGVSSL